MDDGRKEGFFRFSLRNVKMCVRHKSAPSEQ